MKSLLFLLLLIATSLLANAQDYEYVAHKFFTNMGKKDMELFKKAIEKNGRQDLIYGIIKKQKDILGLRDEENYTLETMHNNFVSEFVNPHKTSNCKYAKAYKNKAVASHKRLNSLKLNVALAKTNYQLCKNNRYRTTNCTAQYNNYARLARLYNNVVYQTKSYAKKAKYYVEKCNYSISIYNDELRNLKTKEKALIRRYTLRNEQAVNDLNNDLQLILDLMAKESN